MCKMDPSGRPRMRAPRAERHSERRAARAQHGLAGGAVARNGPAKRPHSIVSKRERGGGAWQCARKHNSADVIIVDRKVHRRFV